MTAIQLPLIPPPQFWGRVGWGSNEEAPDVCFLRRFLVLIFLAMRTPLLPRDKARRLRSVQTDAERRLWMRLRRHQLPCGRSLSTDKLCDEFAPDDLGLLAFPQLESCEESDRKVVDAPNVVAEHVTPALRVAQLVPELLQFLDIVSGVVRMRKIGRPEEAIAAAELNHCRQ